MIFTTSYKDKGLQDIIRGLVGLYQPKIAVDLGTQQGASAILIANAMPDDGHLDTYDLFLDDYCEPPYLPTHADLENTRYNIDALGLRYKINIRIKDAILSHNDFNYADLLHIDICNHYDNVKPILQNWCTKVGQMIILEGGRHNHWQHQYEFKPFYPILTEPWIELKYHSIIFSKNENEAVTIMMRNYL